MTIVAEPAAPLPTLSRAESRAREERRRRLNAAIMAERARAELARQGRCYVNAGLATAAGTVPEGERCAVTVNAALATATATSAAGAPAMATDPVRERQRRADRRYYQRHRAELLESKRQWRQDNPELAHARDRRGRQADLLLDFIHGDRTRRSGRGLHSRFAIRHCVTGCSHPAVTAAM